jgi:hypothetical protein
MHVFSSPCHVNIFYMLIHTIDNLSSSKLYKKKNYICENILLTRYSERVSLEQLRRLLVVVISSFCNSRSKG